MEAHELLSILEVVIQQDAPAKFDDGILIDATYDGDHKSGELLIVTENHDGSKQEWKLSSAQVKDITDEKE